MNHKPFVILLASVSGLACFAAEPAPQSVTISGIPEPGLIIWGTVIRSGSNTPAEIKTVKWKVQEKPASSNPSSNGTPAGTPEPKMYGKSRVISRDGKDYFVAQIPFDSRLIGGAKLAEPTASDVVPKVQEPSLPLSLPSQGLGSYTLTPIVNGNQANVMSVDGTAIDPNNPVLEVKSFSAKNRGRVIHVELVVP